MIDSKNLIQFSILKEIWKAVIREIIDCIEKVRDFASRVYNFYFLNHIIIDLQCEAEKRSVFREELRIKVNFFGRRFFHEDKTYT